METSCIILGNFFFPPLSVTPCRFTQAVAVSAIGSFSLLSSIPWCGWTTGCFPIHLLKDTGLFPVWSYHEYSHELARTGVCVRARGCVCEGKCFSLVGLLLQSIILWVVCKQEKAISRLRSLKVRVLSISRGSGNQVLRRALSWVAECCLLYESS